MACMRSTTKLLVAAAIVAACAAPKRDFNADQIKAIDKFEELMWVHATVADPRFKLVGKVDPNAMTDAEFAEFQDMGHRLQLTAKRIPEFTKGKSFDRFGKELGDYARELEQAAIARKGPATAKLVVDIKMTCKRLIFV